MSYSKKNGSSFGDLPSKNQTKYPFTTDSLTTKLLVVFCCSAVILSGLIFSQNYSRISREKTDLSNFFSSYLQCSHFKPSVVKKFLPAAEKSFCKRPSTFSSYARFLSSKNFLVGDREKGLSYGLLAYEFSKKLITHSPLVSLQCRIVKEQTQGYYSKALESCKLLLRTLKERQDIDSHLYLCTLLRAISLSKKIGIDASSFWEETSKHPLFSAYCAFFSQGASSFEEYMKNSNC